MRARLWLLGVAAAVLAATAARLPCLGAEFWLDEIWSWELAREAASPLAVLFATRHDNNHHLNTLFLHFYPDDVWWGWYRLHSVVAGVLSVVVAAKVARRWGRAEAVIAAWLVAACSWLVLASAEARGYALVVLFALVAFDALWAYLDTRSRLALAVYWLATVAGFLSHPTFLHATIGFVVWSLRRFARERRSAGDEMRRLLITHGVPGAAVGLFYLVAIHGMEKGGGPPTFPLEVPARLLSVGLGGPAAGWWMLAWVAAAIALFVEGVRRLRHEGSDVWVLFVASCAASPGLYVLNFQMQYLLGQKPYLFERYFFIPLAFFLVLMAHALVPRRIPLTPPPPLPLRGEGEQETKPEAPARRSFRFPLSPWWERGLGGEGVVAALLLAYLAGNAWTVWRFVESGRGRFHEALAIVADADNGYSRITGDDHFQVRKYVLFYRRQLYPTHTMLYLEPGEGAPDWYFIHRLDERYPPGDEERDRDGSRYYLVKAFPSRGPGAWGWFLYSAKKRDIRQ